MPHVIAAVKHTAVAALIATLLGSTGAARAAELEELHRLAPEVVAHGEAVLAARVGEPRDLLPVGRPRGVAVVAAARLRQVARVAVLPRHRDDLPAELERRAVAERRDRRA